MSHTDFNHLLASINSLSPEQVKQLRHQLDSQIAGSTQPRAQAPGERAKRTKATRPAARKPLTEAEFNQHLLSIGLVTSFPDPALDIDDDDPDDAPVTIKGEPLSETIIRERR